MIDYKDPVPPIVQFLKQAYEGRISIYGNSFPSTLRLPGLIVRSVGGSDAYRIQLLSRANDDITAMSNLIDVMNYFQRYGSHIRGINAKWVERESQPIASVDEDSGKPEAWCYMRLEALETD